MRIINILFFSLLLFVSGFRALAEDYMRCSDLGLFWGGCKLNGSTLYPETKTERNFAVQYKFSYHGHAIDIGFKTDKGFHRLSPSTEVQEVVLIGRSLTLFDQDPTGTLKSTFDSNCELQILRSTASLSDAANSVLKTLCEESSIIADSVSALLRASDAISSMMGRVEKASLEDLIWQRDHLRSMFTKMDLNLLSLRDRIVFKANLRLLDEMIIKTADDTIGIAAKLGEIASEAFKVIRDQQCALLDRIAELRLRATEMLVDVGQMDSADWSEIFENLDKSEKSLNSTAAF